MILSKSKTKEQQTMINDVLFMIESFGVSVNSMTERLRTKMAVDFLALANMRIGKKWSNAEDVTKVQLGTREIIRYVNKYFNENISLGSYDDIRRKDLKPLLLAGIVVRSKPESNPNDSTRGYGISIEYCSVVRTYKTSEWEIKLAKIIDEKGKFENTVKSRKVKKVQVIIPNKDDVYLSLGEHNELQKRIIDDMLPSFCYQDTKVLYLGDTTKKQIINEEKTLKSLQFFELKHRMLPDIIAYSQKQNWIYLIEAVYTSNPISNNRKIELENLTSKCTANIVYVTAFLNRSDFRKYISDIAWETEVWIADEPEHMIHFDGDKFVSPY